MTRIDVRISSDLPESDEFPAEVRVESKGGRAWVERRDVPPGGSTRPLSTEAIVEKLRACAEGRLAPAAIDRIITLVDGLERLADVRERCEALEGTSELRPT